MCVGGGMVVVHNLNSIKNFDLFMRYKWIVMNGHASPAHNIYILACMAIVAESQMI